MGEGQITLFASMLAKKLEKPKENNYTEKSFRRSVATQLVEAGMSVAGLLEAGNWKSTETAREHAEHSNISAETRMEMLDGNKREMCVKEETHQERSLRQIQNRKSSDIITSATAPSSKSATHRLQVHRRF